MLASELEIGRDYRTICINGARWKLISIDQIFDDGNAIITIMYRKKLYAAGSSQLSYKISNTK